VKAAYAAHVFAEIVAAGLAGRACPAGFGTVERDGVADGKLADVVADRTNRAGGLDSDHDR